MGILKFLLILRFFVALYKRNKYKNLDPVYCVPKPLLLSIAYYFLTYLSVNPHLAKKKYLFRKRIKI